MSLTPFERSLFWDTSPLYTPFSFPKKFDMVVDMKENDNDFILTAELPGIDKSNIDVSIRNNLLNISAEKKEENVKDNSKFHLSERYYGSFKRTITIPNDVDSDNIAAKYKDGILHIVMPKQEKSISKSLKIE